MNDHWNQDPDRRDTTLGALDDRNRGRLVCGLILMALGVTLLLGRFDMVPAHAIARHWPLILIIVGLAKLVSPAERRRPGAALWLIFVGLWAQANVLHWLGLAWRNSWPLILIFVGLRVLVGELMGTSKSEVRDAR